MLQQTSSTMPPVHNGVSTPNDPANMEEGPALAIVGFAFEFPEEATTSEQFWQMICEGRCASKDFPAERFNIETFYHPDESRESTFPVRKAHFVKEDLGAFDAPFFSITPGEASAMDPQQRRMLETAYLALEDAGVPIQDCSGSNTSVYTGCFTSDYSSLVGMDMQEKAQRHTAVGTASTMLANRVSWFFDFKGTSMNIDTACSSSLVALHLACQDLITRTSSMSLVGGTNLIYHPNFMKMVAQSGLLSPDGRCKSFDARGNGYARGEGTAVLVIKRVEDAIRDGDVIRAVIRNTGSNQDGRTPAITQPSMDSQLTLIERTYRLANLDMAPTRFFEAHGTGTAVGDPIEANAIGRAFGHCRSASDPLYIGAVKANVGHLEGASGVAGLIKTLLILEHGVIPPIAGLETVNPRIDADGLKLNFPQKAIPWPTDGLRRACVNSFGFGGTNAIAILDDAYHYLSSRGLRGYHRTRVSRPSTDSPTLTNYMFSQKMRVFKDASAPDDGSTKLLVLSAAGQKVCETVTSQYEEYIKTHPDQTASLAYTLAERRSLFSWRSFIVADSHSAEAQESGANPVRARSDARVAFVFTGQGAQYLGMGRELVRYPVFRDTLQALQRHLSDMGAPWSIHQFLEPNSSVSIDEPQYSQPLTTCLQIALVDLLKSFGISPSVVVGHSSGEIAAAYAAGSLSRFSAVKVAYYRGLLSSKLAKSETNLSMMAVGLSAEDTAPYLERLKQFLGNLDLEVSIGCINSPRSVTLTGNVENLGILQKWFNEASVFARRLRVPIAYHSPVMDKISNEYRGLMGNLEPGDMINLKRTPMISSVTEDVVSPRTLCQPEYWVQNMVSPVKFQGALGKILAQHDKAPRKQLGKLRTAQLSVTHLLEIGPHGALRGPVGDILRESVSTEKPSYLQALDRKISAHRSLLVAIGKLHCVGFPVDLRAVNSSGMNGIVDSNSKVPQAMPHSLPPYPFNHSQSYWNEGRHSKGLRYREHARHDLLGTRVTDWNPEIAQWRNTIRLNEAPWLRDHKVDDQITFPAAGMLAMAVEAFRQLHDTSGLIQSIHLQDVEFKRALIFGSNTNAIETSLFLSATATKSDGSSWSHFKLFQIENDTDGECCSGFIRGEFDQNSSAVPGHLQEWAKDISSACCEPQNPYTLIDQTAMQYDNAFRVLEDLQRLPQTQIDTKLRADQAVAKLRTDNWKDSETSDPQNQQFTFHPCTLDGLAQMLLLAVFCVKDRMLGLVPKKVSRVWIDCRVKAHSANQLRGIAKCVHVGRRSATTDIMATSLNLEPVVSFQGVEASFIESATRLGKNQTDSSSRPLCTRLIWKKDTEPVSAEAPANREARPEDPLKNRMGNLQDDIFVVRNPSHSYQNDMADLIANSWPRTTVFTLEEISSVDIPTSTIVVFLVELQELFLDGISETNFELLRATLMKAQHVIWFTEPTAKSSIPVPALGLVDGLSRVISSEDSSHRFITVALDGSETRDRFLGMLSKVTRSILDDPLDVMETAYSSNGGVFEMPRLCENDIVNDQVSSTLAPYQQDERQIDNLHASLYVGNPGSLQTLELVEHEMGPPTPLENQIVVRVKAFGLTWQDYLCATGAIDQLLMGTECAGVVEQTGPDVTKFQPGDHVFVIGEGLACTSVCVSADSAALIPSVITGFSEAASLPTSLWLAFYSLHKLANLEEGEWVLIQQATSSVGQLLIQMAIKRGAHVIATVSSPTKQKLLRERFKDLPADRIFLHSDGEIVEKVQSVTNRSGIEVVIGSLENWSGADLSACLAAYARIIDIGVSSSHSSANIWRPSQRAANISRASVNLVELLQHKPATVYRTFQQAVKFWFEKDHSTLKPLVLDVFPASDIEAGFRRMQERDAVGKSIIELRQGLTVKIKTRTRPSYQLSSQSTYVISGGLGGLGRTLARWMVKRGARYLILLSRSGPKTSEARDLIRELEEKGATVATPKVDVGKLSELTKTLTELLSFMPPIRGCIQGSMVLRDALFDNMTYEDWKFAIAAKADVSWNLHLTMPSDLDFFILVSSVSGIIGNRGQANYAAGNTYQDALAHYRISQGLKAVTIDMGVMLNDGVAAENETLLNTIRKFGHLIEITQDEVLALFDYYCNPQLPLLSRDHVQSVVGLEMPSTIVAKGVTLHHSFRRPMFRELFEMGSVVYDSSKEGSINRPAALKSASEEEADHLVTGWIALQVSHVLGLEETDIQVDKPLHAHGIDSLVAVDLKNWFFNELGAKVTVFDIMGNSSIQQIATMVAKRSRFRSG